MDSTKLTFSFSEAGEKLGASYWTIWRGAEAGDIKTINLGSRRVIPFEELERIAREGFGTRKRRRAECTAAGAPLRG